MKIVKTIYLKAPPEHVWKYLTEADLLSAWFHKGGADLKEGGDYLLLSTKHDAYGEKLCWGKVLETKEPERLVHTFTHGGLQEVETTCTWTLEGVKGGTIVTLVHDGWEKFEADPFGMAANHDSGWDEHFSRLRRVTGY